MSCYEHRRSRVRRDLAKPDQTGQLNVRLLRVLATSYGHPGAEREKIQPSSFSSQNSKRSQFIPSTKIWLGT